MKSLFEKITSLDVALNQQIDWLILPLCLDKIDKLLKLQLIDINWQTIEWQCHVKHQRRLHFLDNTVNKDILALPCVKLITLLSELDAIKSHVSQIDEQIKAMDEDLATIYDDKIQLYLQQKSKYETLVKNTNLVVKKRLDNLLDYQCFDALVDFPDDLQESSGAYYHQLFNFLYQRDPSLAESLFDKAVLQLDLVNLDDDFVVLVPNNISNFIKLVKFFFGKFDIIWGYYENLLLQKNSIWILLAKLQIINQQDVLINDLLKIQQFLKHYKQELQLEHDKLWFISFVRKSVIQGMIEHVSLMESIIDNKIKILIDEEVNKNPQSIKIISIVNFDKFNSTANPEYKLWQNQKILSVFIKAVLSSGFDSWSDLEQIIYYWPRIVGYRMQDQVIYKLNYLVRYLQGKANYKPSKIEKTSTLLLKLYSRDVSGVLFLRHFIQALQLKRQLILGEAVTLEDVPHDLEINLGSRKPYWQYADENIGVTANLVLSELQKYQSLRPILADILARSWCLDYTNNFLSNLDESFNLSNLDMLSWLINNMQARNIDILKSKLTQPIFKHLIKKPWSLLNYQFLCQLNKQNSLQYLLHGFESLLLCRDKGFYTIFKTYAWINLTPDFILALSKIIKNAINNFYNHNANLNADFLTELTNISSIKYLCLKPYALLEKINNLKHIQSSLEGIKHLSFSNHSIWKDKLQDIDKLALQLDSSACNSLLYNVYKALNCIFYQAIKSANNEIVVLNKIEQSYLAIINILQHSQWKVYFADWYTIMSHKHKVPNAGQDLINDMRTRPSDFDHKFIQAMLNLNLIKQLYIEMIKTNLSYEKHVEREQKTMELNYG